MQEVRANTKSIPFPNLIKQSQLFAEGMKPTLYTKGDVLPEQGFPLFNRRIKPIHPVGVIGKVSLVSDGNHPFTGIFEGADSGILRLSSAWEPTTFHVKPMEPGMGLKFVRSGVDSANLVAVRTKIF